MTCESGWMEMSGQNEMKDFTLIKVFNISKRKIKVFSSRETAYLKPHRSQSHPGVVFV